MSSIPAPGLLELLKWALRRRVRYRVTGDSMLPTLSPDDFVLVDPRAFEGRQPAPGDVVVARHPYRDQVIIKRVSEVVEGGVLVRGDNAEASSDSRSFGQDSSTEIVGRVTSHIS